MTYGKGQNISHHCFLLFFLITYIATNFFSFSFSREILVSMMAFSLLGVRKLSYTHIIYVIVLFITLTCGYFVLGFKLGFLLVFFPTVVFAFYLVNNAYRTYSWKPEFTILLLLSAFLTFKLLTVENVNEDILVTSRNQISVLLFVVFFFLLLSNPPRKILLMSCLMIFFVCLVSLSRSAIMASGVLLFLFVFLEFGSRFFLLIIAIFLVFFIVEFEMLYDYFSLMLSLSWLDDPRMTVIHCYFEKIDLPSIVFGLNYSGEECPLLVVPGHYTIENANAHNSYLSLMSYSTIFFVLSIPVLLVRLNRQRFSSNVFFCFGCAFFIRAYFDNIIFFSEIDFIFWFFIFYSRTKIIRERLMESSTSRQGEVANIF